MDKTEIITICHEICGPRAPEIIGAISETATRHETGVACLFPFHMDDHSRQFLPGDCLHGNRPRSSGLGIWIAAQVGLFLTIGVQRSSIRHMIPRGFAALRDYFL